MQDLSALLVKRGFAGPAAESKTEAGREVPESQNPKTTARVGPTVPSDSCEDIELALKIRGHLETLPGHVSATCTEMGDALFGKRCTLAQIMEIYSICEDLRKTGILIEGRNGYGYQLARQR
jgi:hypothetical protein